MYRIIWGDKKMENQVEKIVLNKLDKYEFSENISESLREDNIAESCYTNFKDALIDTIIQMVHETMEKDGWKIKAFEKNKEEKIFDAFMKNGEFKVLLSKKVDKSNDMSKVIIIKLDFPENEKKEIAKTYVDNLLEGYYYLDICLFTEIEEEVNVDTVSKILSDEVYGILSPEEIKKEFQDKIEEAINIVFNDGVDVDIDCDIDEEEE